MFLLFFPDLSLSVPGQLFLFPFEAALFLSLERGLPSERHLFAALQFENPTALSKDLGISLIAAKEGNFLEAERIFLGGPESAGKFFQCTERRERGGGGRRESVTRVSLNSGGSTRLRMRSNLFLVVCKCFSILTSSTVVLCIAVNVFDGIFRCYEVLIAAFVVLAETEWELIKFLKVELASYVKQLYAQTSESASYVWHDIGLPTSRMLVWYKSTFSAPLGTDPVVVDLMGLGKEEAWINVRALEGVGQILKPMKMVAVIFVIIVEHTIVISA
ncbi:hypothetical protein FEM48_Zijuj07G0112100 [Ziziphus jujuba var. spinosa]|uniref:Uncharacterized protein n=1 Tax=Ziziphus jujuba var. spinosa TaxID=714518 RepID=A0A978V4A7_ZIZJJ|nr:hypothetical protein FEM48_Zijuj07G0112100 [Ziziphus jujuba var. spinosa]